jgi:membrane protein DedA with SNARE-associated domain
MSEVLSPWGRRLLSSFRSGRALQIAIGALIALVILIVIALLYGDLPEFLNPLGRELRQVVRHQQYLPGYGALYLEESGVPLPAPGDVFVMFVGAHVPRHWAAWIGAWLGLIFVVVLGATNLFFISRRYGRRLATSSLAEYIHLNHERMERAEVWFKRYGVLAIIFGRHIPGFRIPITVACGVFEIRYRVFAPSVAVSTAVWAGVMLFIGVRFGPRLGQLLEAHTFVYFAWAAIVVALFGSIFVRQQLRARRARLAAAMAARARAGPPVESPGPSES